MGKKNTYILLLAALIVWGILGYKFFKAFNPTPKIKKQEITIANFKPKEIKQAETFSIKADYRDPFLGTFATNSKPKKVKKKSAVKKDTKQEKIIFPNISYKGIVSPKGGNEKVFLIKINNQSYLFKQSQTHKEVQLLQGNKKEVVLQYKTAEKTFPLNK